MSEGSPNGVAPIHRRLVAIGVVTILGFLAACSLPVDERVTPIDRDEFGEQLTADTTTTTSTSSTSVVPTVAVSADSSTTTTTVAPIPTETITVFYTRGFTDAMQPVQYDRAVGTPLDEVIAQLEQQSGLAEAGLRTAVLPGLIDGSPAVERAVATVDLDGDVLDRMPNSVLERAIAQIVLTLTSFVTPDAGAIGAVRFAVDGEGFPVFVPGFGGSSEPDEPLVFTDFASLITTTPTAGTTTTVTTTVPPDVDAATSAAGT